MDTATSTLPRRRGPKLPELALTDEERTTLERWARRRTSGQALALRCRIVLACASGASNAAIAQRLGISRPTVTKWRSRFVAHPGTPQRATHDNTRHATTNLYAALEMASGKVISQLPARHRAVEFKRFLDHIDSQVPAGLDVHVICDNSSTHKTEAIGRWLVAHPRFQLHFTPTYSSWLHLVERWFAELTSKWLRRGTHRSVAELEQAIQAWIDTWNDNPRPFVWTKTADEILDTIATYCQQINDPGH